MTVATQFPSAALWHQVLSGPPVGKDQGTRNPIGGFSDMVHAQLAKQNAIAELQQPQGVPVRAPQIQRAPEKESRERNRNPSRQQRDPQREQQGHDGGRQAGDRRDTAPTRALWA